MTYAWYGHLKDLKSKPLWLAILISWLIAFLEYCFQVPANRIGYQNLTLAQLKVIQEVITMTVFTGFAFFYMNQKITLNLLYASICLIGAAYFIFQDV
jgi:uncharacterized protein (DUF486 family)